MKINAIFHWRLAILVTVTLGLGQSPCISQIPPMNVLFIAVDDLRPELGCYGHSNIHSPNIDSLARRGMLFERAYCQQAVCNPSRSSLMTGMRPDSLGVTGNHLHFRSNHPNVVTLPQHFKQHGYQSEAIGKIFHGVFPDGSSKTKWDTMGDPASWSVPAIRFGPRYYYTEDGIAAAKLAYQQMYKPQNPGADDWTNKLVFGPATEAPDVADNALYDGKVADAAVNRLQQLATTAKPFFLAVGFIKPHSPYIAPKKYFDLYNDVAMPSDIPFPTDAPSYAGHGSAELRRYTDQPKRGSIPDQTQLRVRHAYYACISYIDAQIGRVIAALEQTGLSENTIVVLFGDHGYHLGEQGLWGKTTNYELDTRVPLIVMTPGMSAAGKSTSSLVELVDLYPTLCELAELPVSKQLESNSFAPILDDPTHVTKQVALSQYPRGGGLMGYSIRTPTHRLTQWMHQKSGVFHETELYDYSAGLVETRNIAASAPALVSKLLPRLMSSFGISFLASHKPQVTPDQPDVESKVGQTSFETAKAGQFDEVKNGVGTWRSEAGKCIIDNKHAKTGRHCLQLTGGEKSTVTLDISDKVDVTGDLTFAAERWTSRSPFSFRIEKRTDAGWSELFNGDRTIRVGRPFLSNVKIPLGDVPISQLRFSVTSPPGTGILIDDVRIAPAVPQKIVSAEIVPLTLPALVGTDSSPLLKLKIETIGSRNPISLTEVKAAILSELGDVVSAQAFWTAGTDQFTKTIPFGQVDRIADSGQQQDAGREPGKKGTVETTAVAFTGNQTLQEGKNYIWIACKLAKDADISHQVGAMCREVTFSDGGTLNVESKPQIQRLGIALRQGGDDGVHTFRIPGLATTNRGTLIGVYDVRHRSGGDLPGDIDVGMSRSCDGGRTWEPMKVIMDMGDNRQWNHDGIGDPAVLVDQNTGTVWVAATWSHGNRSWLGSGPGLTPDETGQLMLVRSDDDGVTWSAPINITSQVKKPDWCFILQGPGKGITMRDGTIVFAAQYQDPPEKKRLPHSTIIYSKDHGDTWQVGTGAFDDTTESQVVEIEPGVLMLNCRYNRKGLRVVMTTSDMGETWQRHTTSERSLIEPGACMASLIDVDQEVGKDVGKWLLFSNPDSTRGRNHITIKGSPDRGLTWPKEHRLLLDEQNSAGYSCMSMIDEYTVGILYEGSQSHMTFQRIALTDLMGSESPQQSGGSAVPLDSDGAREPPDEQGSIDPHDIHSSVVSLRLPTVFGSHMVLQADAPLPIWGVANPGSEVSLQLGDDERKTTANPQGEWRVQFPSRNASGIATSLTVQSGDQHIVLTDILIGEVWVCAGQSNMDWPLVQSENGQQELAAVNHPQLRLLHLVGGASGSGGSYTHQHLSRLDPDTFCEGRWQVASAKSASNFSAVSWYFGRKLQDSLNVPVGLICPAVGGTPAESWVPADALRDSPELKGLVAGNWLDNERLGEFCRTRGEQNLLSAMQAGENIPGDGWGPNHSFKPGFMWSAGIQPLIPFAIRGTIWYQGESNAETPARVREHGLLFPLLIHQWRKRWGQGDFPFLYVQLPALNRPEWPSFRDGQRRTLGKLSHVGMAVTIDTGHPSNVHPRLKMPVGQRLASWALATTYGLQGSHSPSGPLFEFVQRQGNTLVVSFRHVGDGLKSLDRQPIRHFEVCGRDGIFQPAMATIIGPHNVAVSSSDVADPHDARYAWSPYPDPSVNLVNSDELPASPFSTESEEAVFARSVQVERTASDKDQRPNILLIVSEDNGPELGCYGDKYARTPNLDQLAADGVRFETAYVTQAVCSSSRSTIFTGLYPHQNGQIGLATHKFEMFRDWPTTYSLLKAAGYRTGLLGKTHVNPSSVIESHVDFRRIPSSNFSKKDLDVYAKESAAFINASDRPFFLTVNFPDAHWPVQDQVQGRPKTVTGPEIAGPLPYIGFDNNRLRGHLSGFYNCMARLDECVGELIDELAKSGKADNTLVIYIGDHGAQFARGKVFVTEGGLRIPFVVRWPGIAKRGLVSQQLVSTIDLLPTIVAAAGIQKPDYLPGKDLAAVLNGQTKTLRDYLFAERNCDSADLHFPQRAIRDSRYKLIKTLLTDRPDPGAHKCLVNGASNFRGSPTYEELKTADQRTQTAYATWLNPPEYQLYDLKNDRHEFTNVTDDPNLAEVKTRLINRLSQWQHETDDKLRIPEMLEHLTQEIDDCREQKLRSPQGGWEYTKYMAPTITD